MWCADASYSMDFEHWIEKVDVEEITFSDIIAELNEECADTLIDLVD